MQKFLGTIVLGLCLVCNNSFAKEIILNCYQVEPESPTDIQISVAKITGTKIDSEIDLQKKIIHFDGYKFDIVLETQRKIVAKKSNERITIDRYDGILVLDDVSSTPVKNISRHVCEIQKEEKKLF